MRVNKVICVNVATLFLVVMHAASAPARAYPRPGNLERVDVSTDGRSFPGSCGFYSSVSASGRFVVFDTDAPLVIEDVNQEVDIYVRDLKEGTTELISKTPLGLPAVGPGDPPGCVGRSLSWNPSITPNGRYVAFASSASNLVDGDTNAVADVFVYDRETRAMEQVSVNSRGQQGTAEGAEDNTGEAGGHSWGASISASGRYVSFTSSANNLVPNDTNDSEDVFVHDRSTGKTRRVSVTSEGAQSDPCPPDPTCLLTYRAPHSSISLNGRFVVFDSRAPDLVAGDTNGISDVFVHDVRTRRTDRVSVASDGTQAQDLQENRANAPNGWSGSTISGWTRWDAARVISANGRYVAFVSSATNLVPSDTNRHGAATAYLWPGGADAFVHDRKTGRTERVSVASDGREQNRCVETAACHVENPGISADGRYVSFMCVGPSGDVEGTRACELSQDHERESGIAVFDRKTGELVHAAAPFDEQGRPISATYPGPDISPSGRYVSFVAYGTELLGGGYQTLLYDRGAALGVGGFGGEREPSEEPGGARICITPDICIFPLDALSTRDPLGDVDDHTAIPRGADIIGVRLASRPQLDDLYLRLDVSEMPAVRGTPVVGDPAMMYGFRFHVGSAIYEVRATPLVGDRLTLAPAFGLFRCDGDLCTEITGLKGGYGTAGESVVAAIPLGYLRNRLDSNIRISKLKAYSAWGTPLGGKPRTLDEAKLGWSWGEAK